MSVHFNPRPREGGDNALIRAVVPGSISIHAPREGGDRRAAGHSVCAAVISIHAPARGATQAGRTADTITRISIHAPARGATRSGIAWFAPRVISIHAPARGATAFFATSSARHGNFNPRPREGGDLAVKVVDAYPSISIHDTQDRKSVV